MIGDVKSFMDDMELHFGAPRLPEDLDSSKFYKAFADELGHFSNRCLELSAKKLISSRDKRTFPLLAECLKACRDVQEQLAAEVTPAAAPKPKYPEWAQDAIAEANRLICSDIGRRAAAEGWIIGLWDFCRENRRWPNAPEANHVKAKSLATWRELKEFEDNPETVAGALVLINTFKAKRNKLAGIARGRIAA